MIPEAPGLFGLAASLPVRALFEIAASSDVTIGCHSRR